MTESAPVAFIGLELSVIQRRANLSRCAGSG
jgi:hypothetical protein